jgi:hypothetical protein
MTLSLGLLQRAGPFGKPRASSRRHPPLRHWVSIIGGRVLAAVGDELDAPAVPAVPAVPFPK